MVEPSYRSTWGRRWLNTWVLTIAATAVLQSSMALSLFDRKYQSDGSTGPSAKTCRYVKTTREDDARVFV